MNKPQLLIVAQACLAGFYAMSAHAALVSRLGGSAVYDTDQDVTWLSDANTAMTSDHDPDGRMTWDQARAWIGTLNTANYLGFNDWRLPVTLAADGTCTDDTGGNMPSPDSAGYNCIGSEVGHLFYSELGGAAGSPLLSSGDPDLSQFTNIQSDRYWSGTEYASDTGQSWQLSTSNGLQDKGVKSLSLFAWAVRSGDSGILMFVDVTSAAGITHISSQSADRFTGGGAAWVDIDNDGWQDLFVPNPEAGQPNRLYHNTGGSFVEISAFAGVQDSAHQAAGVVVGDYDGDGCDDIFVVNGGSNIQGASERNTLFRNNFCDTGSPLTFSDKTIAANLHNEIANSMVASYGDLDQDGDLDLYVGNYTPDGVINLGFCEQNHYYRNNGDGSFSEQAASVNLADAGCALGLVISDYDDDGDADVYITNDFSDPTSPAYVSGTADIFYSNQGTDAAGNLLPFSVPANNLADATNGMGIAVGDYENDGDLDYYATSFANNTDKQNVVNRNNGDGTFTEVSDAVGMADRPTGSVSDTIGWGALFFDVDLDGDLDMYKANGRIGPLGIGTIARMEQPNRLFRNNGQTSPAFTDIAAAAGVDGLIDSALCWDTSGFSSCYDQSRGVAAADYDNDGDIDLFVVNTGQQDSTTINPLVPQPPRLYQNNASLIGGTWLKVRLEGGYNNRHGIGARIRVASTSAGGSITQVREVLAGSSHGSTDAFAAHFGFPAGSTVTQLTVDWPAIGGQPAVVTTLGSLALSQVITLEETPDNDTDNDGIPDFWEILYGLDSNDPADALADDDGDELNNLGEFTYGTAPNNSDTDNDLSSDGYEVTWESDPVDAASFPFPPVLKFNPAVFTCIDGLGTPPDNCSTGTEVTGGSYFASDINGDGIFLAEERTALAPGPDGGIIIGTPQPAGNSHGGCPDDSESPGLDAAGCFFGQTGVFLTTGAVTVADPDVQGDGGLTKTLDFGGWAVSWNGNLVDSLGGDSENFPQDTGLATLICSEANCPVGSTFTLDYVSHGDPGGSAFFGTGSFHSWHFEGQVANTASVAADGDLNMDGEVNTADVLLASRIALGNLLPTNEQLQQGDVAPLVGGIPKPNGQFNVSDLLVIQRKALGQINF